MAEYTVKAPDGKTITLQGPDGASEADVIAQAQALYEPQSATVAKPVARPGPTRPKPKQTAPFLEKYNTIRNGLVANVPEAQRANALARFDADPRAQKLRQLAGLAPLSTRQGDVKAVAKKSVEQRYREAGGRVGQNSSRLQSFIAGASKGMFGIPQHMQAAVYSVLPNELTGIPEGATYNNILQTIRGRDDASINANLGSGITGEIGGGIAGAGPVGGAVKSVGTRLAANSAPLLARAGRAELPVPGGDKGR